MPAPLFIGSCMADGAFLISCIPSILCLMVVAIITYKSIAPLSSLKKLQPIFKFLYYASCALGMLITLDIFIISFICSSARFHEVNSILMVVLFVSHMSLSLTTLATLLTRCYFTFRNSIFKFNKLQIIGFSVLYTITVSITLYTSIMVIYTAEIKQIHVMQINVNTLGLSILLITLWVCYIGTCICGILAFALKMYKVTKLRSSSITNVVNLVDISKITINSSQAKLLDKTSRYVSVLFFAICSSFMTYIVFFVCASYFFAQDQRPYSLGVALMAASIDCAMNVICLYLQYPFAKKYYDKYCGWSGQFWNWLFTTKAERFLQNKYRSSIMLRSSTNLGNSSLSTLPVSSGRKSKLEKVFEMGNFKNSTARDTNQVPQGSVTEAVTTDAETLEEEDENNKQNENGPADLIIDSSDDVGIDTPPNCVDVVNINADAETVDSIHKSSRDLSTPL